MADSSCYYKGGLGMAQVPTLMAEVVCPSSPCPQHKAWKKLNLPAYWQGEGGQGSGPLTLYLGQTHPQTMGGLP